MRSVLILIGAAAWTFSGALYAGSKEVTEGAPALWVAPAPAPTTAPTDSSAPYRVVYSDQQIHLGPDGVAVFQAFQVKLLKPEALSLGNVSLTWSPDAGEAKVHYLRIIRGQEVIDVLKSSKFQVLQREGFLEQSALNGALTAVLQTPGLQVGDEIAFASTVRAKDPTLGDHLYGFSQLPSNGMPGAFRVRLVWPTATKLKWRTSADVTGISPSAVGAQTELTYELRDPKSEVVADGAPARINLRRSIEFSDFDNWADVSVRISPLFEKSATLSVDSPIRKEVARIAAANSSPLRRMQAALQLVQDQIRYIYIGLNGGNLTPASADETWKRRFGDCKAKTALLLAMLKELHIPAEAVLVNTGGGDGLNERLPTPNGFDHVLVRANLDGKTYWLDGSRLGDRSLDAPYRWRWVLPVRSAGANLEQLPVRTPAPPDSIVVIEADATGGFDQKAAIKIHQVLRGDAALKVQSLLAGLSAADANHALMAYWRKGDGWVEAQTVSWHFDEQRGTVLLTLDGRGKLDWTGDDIKGHDLTLFGAGFTPPDEFHRPSEQDQSAPWITDYPAYHCWATAIRLPDTGPIWSWDYYADPEDTHMGGVHYWRRSDLRDGVVRTVMSRRSEIPEITAAQATEVNAHLPTFNNNMSSVYQVAKGKKAVHERDPQPPFQEDTDWTSAETSCGPPAH